MPDIGFIELIFIGTIAFLVLGPDRLPEFFGQMARFVRQTTAWGADLKQQFEEEKKHVVQPVEGFKQEVQASVGDVKSDLSVRTESN